MLELNEIYLGDCLEIMQNIEKESIDMILCDLPFGTTNCRWDTIIPLNELWVQYERIIKDNGAIVLFAQPPFDKVLACSNLKLFRYEWIWEKSKATGFLNSKRAPLKAHENILVFYKKMPTYNPQFTYGEPYNKGIRKQQDKEDTYGKYEQTEVKSDGRRYPRDVVYFKTAESEGKTYHKTQKPLNLCEYLIKTYTNEGDIVLDNCIGSGTTAVACINTSRNYIGIEKDEQIFNTAVARINQSLAI